MKTAAAALRRIARGMSYLASAIPRPAPEARAQGMRGPVTASGL